MPTGYQKEAIPARSLSSQETRLCQVDKTS